MPIPISGAKNAGSTMKRNVSPAWALEPVIVFTQIDSTSSITESPNIDVGDAGVQPREARLPEGLSHEASAPAAAAVPVSSADGVASTPGRSSGTPHATNSHSREPGGRLPGSVIRSA